ncbi:MAG: hypothetical protein ACJA2S_001465 [Cyclobacteriaceae bacterium]|jgi:hypothetical protein
MNVLHVKRYILIAVLLIVTVSSSFMNSKEKLKYTQIATIATDYKLKQTIVIEYRDTLNLDPLNLVKTKDSIPLHYFKDIITEVCFESECRLLDVTVYWNITGRYLGFELPQGEYLSKYDHEPFVDEEYERLNELMASPNLPLGNISFEKLIELPEANEESVDGVSGATTPEVSKMVVKGAAYTTYTLWNIVHGPTMDLVVSLTEEQLNPDLLNLVLKSLDITDRVWALNRIDQNTELSPKLTSSLLDIIFGGDFFLAYSAVNAIKSTHLNSDAMQIALFSSYQKVDHSIKKMIIEKLMESPHLSNEVVESSRTLLNTLNGQQLKSFLKLYSHFEVNDLETCQAIAEVLKNKNQFISKQAYKFLKGLNVSDERINVLIDNYGLGE